MKKVLTRTGLCGACCIFYLYSDFIVWLKCSSNKFQPNTNIATILYSNGGPQLLIFCVANLFNLEARIEFPPKLIMCIMYEYM